MHPDAKSYLNWMKCYVVLKCHSIWVNAESVKQHHSEERGSVCCRCSNPLCPNITHAAAFLGGWGDAVYNHLHLCVIWKPSVWKSNGWSLILIQNYVTTHDCHCLKFIKFSSLDEKKKRRKRRNIFAEENIWSAKEKKNEEGKAGKYLEN